MREEDIQRTENENQDSRQTHMKWHQVHSPLMIAQNSLNKSKKA